MTPHRTIAISLALLGLLPLGALRAQSTDVPAISTDRPSVGTSPDILSPRSVQMESGVNLAYGSKNYAADLPESLVRIGIGLRSEIRFTSPNLMRQSYAAAGSALMQAQDMAFSMKVGLAEPNSILPKTGLLALSCPSGNKNQTSGSYDPIVGLIWEQVIPHGFTIIENLEAQHTSVSSSRVTNWLPSVLIERSFSPKLSWFAEYAPTFSMHAATLHIVDGGLIYTATSNSQFDLRVGYQNDSAGLHNILSFGYSLRIDDLGRHARTQIR